MTASIRICVDAPLAEGEIVSLTGGQVHYLRSVMRRGIGDDVHVFNARDGEFAAQITHLDKKAGEVRVEEQLRAPAVEPDLWLLNAPVKRAAFELIAQKATELGISKLVPVITERTVVSRVNEERLKAITMEAAEQCERLSVPTIATAQKLTTVLDDWPQDRRLVYCDEAGDDPEREWGGPAGRAGPIIDTLAAFQGNSSPWALLIGPEGGFSPAERTHLRELDFVVPVSLGPRILRADTAAIAALALWQAVLGDWRSR